MAKKTQHSQDSYAPLMYDVQYDQYGTGKFVRLPFHDLFQSLSIHRQLNEAMWTGTLALFDREDSFLGGALRPGLGSKLQIKWWWDNRNDNEALAPVYLASILTITPNYSTEGTGLTLELTGSNATAASLNKDIGPRSFEAGRTYTSIVEEICRALKWRIAVVEESFGKTPEALRMGGESHQEFIRQKILAKSMNKLNEHFDFYIDESDGVHFHSPSFSFLNGKGVDARNLKREYVAYADMVGEVESFAPHDNTFFRMTAGGGDSHHESTDSDGGVPVKQMTTVEHGATNTTTNKTGLPPATSDERHVPNLRPKPDEYAGGGENKTPSSNFSGWIARTPEEANHLLIATHSRLRSIMYTADLAVKGTHEVIPSNYIGVRYFLHNGKEHYLSGVFKVLQLSHELGGSGWKTSMIVSRYGTKADKAEEQLPTTTMKVLSL